MGNSYYGILVGLFFGYFLGYYRNKNTTIENLSSTEKEKSKTIPFFSEKVKMVLLVNEELQMKSGKIAAQCSHVNIYLLNQGSIWNS
jgi:hypothetical protein